MARELILYCDESDIAGAHFANFYGGLLVESSHLSEVQARLSQRKASLNLNGEVKWQKVTENYVSKYVDLMDEFFNLMNEEKIKVRIMFTQRYLQAPDHVLRNAEDSFFKLYYQFVKHAFGLQFSGTDNGQETSVRLYFDKLPDTAERCASFKGYVTGLNHSRAFRDAGIRIRNDQIAEIDSKEHVLLQCLDVVLGAMPFRLNDKHKSKPEGSNVRGKRTIAKEKLYKHILKRIRQLYPGFNVGTSTGKPNGMADLWTMPYRHWRFVPDGAERRPEHAKKRNKKSPASAT